MTEPIRCLRSRRATAAGRATVLLLAACAAAPTYDLRAVLAADANSAAARADRLLATSSDVDRTLFLLESGTCHLLAGNDDQAVDRFRQAGGRMGVLFGIDQDRALSTWHNESVKEFKGEPFEQAMCSLYLGVAAARNGHWQAARCCFRACQLADRSDSGRCDFALPILLEAAAARQLGDLASARRIARALVDPYDTVENGVPRRRVVAPQLALLVEQLVEGDWDTLVLVEDGWVPRKISSGERGAVLAYDADLGDRPNVQLTLDGRSLPLHAVGSMTFQIAETGPRVADAINQEKADEAAGLRRMGAGFLAIAQAAASGAAKPSGVGQPSREAGVAALAVSGAFLIASLMAKPGADTRGWTTLPDRFHIALCRLGTGTHSLAARLAGVPRDDGGERGWTANPRGGTMPLVWLRLLPSGRSSR